MRRSVVISGLGVVSGVGVGASAFWDALCAGRSGIAVPARLDLGGFPGKLACEVRELSVKDAVPKSYRKATKVMARDIEIAVVAAKLAFDHAGLVTRAAEDGRAPTMPGERVGCQIGAGLIAAEAHELTMALASAVAPAPTPAQAARGGFDFARWGTIAQQDGQPVGGMENLPPLWMLKYLPNMLACHVTIIHGCEGPSNTHTNAEASGLLSIGEASRVIERDAADACIAGGAESKLNHMGVLRLTKAGRLGAYDANPDAAQALRPFDASSPGAIVGEGGALLVLEEAAHATRRGARPIARVLGFGASHSAGASLPARGNEASRASRSPHAGQGLALAILAALRDAGLSPADIDAIVPQGCGEVRFDQAERAALAQVFGPRLAQIELVTLAPMLGDCAAGSGGLQAAAAALAVQHQMLPARVGGAVEGLCVGPAPARSAQLRRVLVCTQSLGGQNAAIVLGQ